MLQLVITMLRCFKGYAQMAKLLMGLFAMPKSCYVVVQLRITLFQCSIGCAPMAEVQFGRFPISGNLHF